MTFPISDVLFRHVVTSEVERVQRNGVTLERARRNLEPLFPHVELHRQRVLITDRSTEVWFAFRDGREAVPYPADTWWARPGTARATLHASGRLTGATNAFRAIFHIPRPVPSLVLSRDIMSDGLWAELSRAARGWGAGEGTSSRMVVGNDAASPTELEFHIERNEVRPKQYDIAVRTLDERDAASIAHALRASSLGALDGKKCAALGRGAAQRHLRQGQRLSEAVVGDPWAALVVCGIVRLYVATNGLEPTVLYAKDGSLLGTHLIPVDESLAIGLQAATPALVIQFDPRYIECARHSDGRFARALATDGDMTLRTLVQTYAMRSSADLGQRLAREVLMISELQDDVSLVAVTEQQLADGLGSIRESVARALASFRKNGFVATTRYGLIALDVEALRDGGPSRHGRGA
jgi:CRP/FNR family transcriptional regulator